MMRLSNTLMMNSALLPEGKKAFTLAEVLITLSILGVVAALTIPSLVNRQSDLAAQVKLKKAISTYEDVIGVYMAETEAASAANMFKVSPTQDCSKITDYFKTVKTSAISGNNCDFVTADGVAWRIDVTTGNANITDNEKAGSARYQVAMWNNNNRVNATGKSDNVTNVSTLVTGVYGSSSLIDSRRHMTSAPLFLQGSSSDAENKLYCADGDVTATAADGTVACP